MREVAYLFERFPSFGQTFCYREVAELERQGTKVHVFSIRRPLNEPAQDWDKRKSASRPPISNRAARTRARTR